jgi:hypothetical protein
LGSDCRFQLIWRDGGEVYALKCAAFRGLFRLRRSEALGKACHVSKRILLTMRSFLDLMHWITYSSLAQQIVAYMSANIYAIGLPEHLQQRMGLKTAEIQGL